MFICCRKKKELERYVYESGSVNRRVPGFKGALAQKVKNTPMPTIEKIIVDIFTDQKLFSTFQGSELSNNINTAYNRYQLDFTKLFSYAKRRRKETDLTEYLSRYTDIPQTILHD